MMTCDQLVKTNLKQQCKIWKLVAQTSPTAKKWHRPMLMLRPFNCPVSQHIRLQDMSVTSYIQEYLHFITWHL